MSERKIRIITVIVSIALFILLATFTALKIRSLMKSRSANVEQAAATRTVKIKDNGMKLLDDELLLEDYRIYYENQQANAGVFRTILYAMMFLIIAIVIITIVSKIAIAFSRQESIPILSVAMTLVFGILCIVTMFFFMSGIGKNLNKDESEFDTVVISVLRKDTKVTHDADGNSTTLYYLYLDDGYGNETQRKVTKSIYDSVTEGHLYYLAMTQDNVWFAVYDTQEYEPLSTNQ